MICIDCSREFAPESQKPNMSPIKRCPVCRRLGAIEDKLMFLKKLYYKLVTLYEPKLQAQSKSGDFPQTQTK